PSAPTELIAGPPPPEPPEPPPDRELWPWLLVLLLLVLAVIAAVWYATRDRGTSSPAQTRVTTVAAAAAQAKPKPKRKQQATPPAEQVAVPDLVGQQRADAVGTLAAQHLDASVNEVPSEQEPGVVVAQAPRAGTRVDEGSAVTLNVSKGPSRPAPVSVAVPDVVGQSKDAAKDAIAAAGLEPSIQHVPSTQPADTVVSQSPGAGSSAQKGDGVLLNVSEGPSPQPKHGQKEKKTKTKPTKPVRSQQPATQSVPSVVGEDE